MRRLVNIENIEHAQRLRWYLESQGVEAWQDDESAERGQIWLLDEGQRKNALEIVERFNANPNLAEVEASAKSACKAHDHNISAEIRAREQKVKAAARLNQLPLTSTVIFFCALIFIVRQYFDPQHTVYQWLAFSVDPSSHVLGEKNFTEILNGQVWRLFSPIFMHGDWLHVIFNMIWFFKFSSQLEKNFSISHILLVLFLIASSSNIVFYLISGPQFLGMSGVVYGFALYLWAMNRYSKNYIQFDPEPLQFLGIWYCLCLVLTIVGFGVANSIHGIGALSGVCIAVVASKALPRVFRELKNSAESRKISFYAFLLLLAGVFIDYFKSH